MTEDFSRVFKDTKQHYALLDGFRGVAAVLVMFFHVFEGYSFAGGEGAVITGINHGYLAVDFFFMLSGFVIAYAYNDRMASGAMSRKGFMLRRIIRLHPMIIVASIFGLITYMLQGSVTWGGESMPISAILVALFSSMLLIPALPGGYGEVRGNGEMYPLNGPFWSLFFEYIGSIIYAIALCKVSTKILAGIACLLGVALALFSMTDYSGYGQLGVGWTIDTVNVIGGSLRMLFPFTLGLLLSRLAINIKIKGAFWIGALILLALFLVPYIPSTGALCVNGVFEFVCIAAIFPIIIILGASGKTTDLFSTKTCNMLGAISYPAYVIHYPVMYLFYAWLIANPEFIGWGNSWYIAISIVVICIALAYTLLRFYDLPVRRWLSRKFLKH